MEVRERKLSNHRVFSMSSDEIDAIVRSNPKVSKENTLFSVFAHFFVELFISFTGSSAVKVSTRQGALQGAC